MDPSLLLGETSEVGEESGTPVVLNSSAAPRRQATLLEEVVEEEEEEGGVVPSVDTPPVAHDIPSAMDEENDDGTDDDDNNNNNNSTNSSNQVAATSTTHDDGSERSVVDEQQQQQQQQQQPNATTAKDAVSNEHRDTQQTNSESATESSSGVGGVSERSQTHAQSQQSVDTAHTDTQMVDDEDEDEVDEDDSESTALPTTLDPEEAAAEAKSKAAAANSMNVNEDGEAGNNDVGGDQDDTASQSSSKRGRGRGRGRGRARGRARGRGRNRGEDGEGGDREDESEHKSSKKRQSAVSLATLGYKTRAEALKHLAELKVLYETKRREMPEYGKGSKYVVRNNEDTIEDSKLEEYVPRLIRNSGGMAHLNTLVEYVATAFPNLQRRDGTQANINDYRRVLENHIHNTIGVYDYDERDQYVGAAVSADSRTAHSNDGEPLYQALVRSLEERRAPIHVDDAISFVINHWARTRHTQTLPKEDVDSMVRATLLSDPRFKATDASRMSFTLVKRSRSQSTASFIGVDPILGDNSTYGRPGAGLDLFEGEDETARAKRERKRRRREEQQIEPVRRVDPDSWICCDMCTKWVKCKDDPSIIDLSLYDDSNPDHLDYYCIECRRKQELASGRRITDIIEGRDRNAPYYNSRSSNAKSKKYTEEEEVLEDENASSSDDNNSDDGGVALDDVEKGLMEAFDEEDMGDDQTFLNDPDRWQQLEKQIVSFVEDVNNYKKSLLKTREEVRRQNLEKTRHQQAVYVAQLERERRRLNRQAEEKWADHLRRYFDQRKKKLLEARARLLP